ncbi:hypothetical protein LTR72_012353, partial [Exophiala xenobiotica]
FVASTPNARYDATKRALRASKHARGLATIKVLAQCHALLRATDYRATNAVRGTFLVAINARECVEKSALSRTAS